MKKRNFKIKLRDMGSDPDLQGYAFRFSESVEYQGQMERFSPDLEVGEGPRGTFLLRDHDPGKILARVPKTMSIETDKEGLKFSARSLDTELWNETRELIKNGVLNGASVGFTEDKSHRDGDTLVYDSVRIYEISLLAYPAYESSEVKARENKTLKNRFLPPELYL